MYVSDPYVEAIRRAIRETAAVEGHKWASGQVMLAALAIVAGDFILMAPPERQEGLKTALTNGVAQHMARKGAPWKWPD